MPSSKPAQDLAGLRDLVRSWILGPQLLAFLPALTLGGYWLGGEAALLLIAIAIPAVLGLGGLYTVRDGSSHVMRDATTGLPFRDSLVSFLDEALLRVDETGHTTTAFTVVIDEFDVLVKRVGTAGQDRVLVATSDRIKSTMRDEDLVARLEGPIFGIGLAPIRRNDVETLIQMAARIQKAFEAPISVDGLRVYVSVSIGFCSRERATEKTGESILSSALFALDEAQARGHGTVRAFSPEMQTRVRARGTLAAEISEALDNGGIRAWFQPQVSTNTGEVTGFEALARWIHPDRGIIAPGDFLPLIEASGLTQRLSEVMLYDALSALREWGRTGVDVPTVGVNFSIDELRNPQLVDKLIWELDRFDMTPDRLAIEVLETVIAETDNDVIIRNLSALSELGCNIDLDDFGTGHASIGNIRRFLVDRIKIDRSFVTNVDTDRDQQGMVAAILTLAERLELDTLAEGVESVGEHAMLAQLGCGHVQGYSIGRPMPFSDTAQWMEDHQRKVADAQSPLMRAAANRRTQ